jgi:hypothetical protein
MSPFEQLQTDIEHYLKSDEDLRDLAITHVRPRTAKEAATIQGDLDKVLAGLLAGPSGKKGISVIVNMPELVKVEGNVRAVTGDLSISLRVVEHVMINMGLDGTQRSAEAWALMIANRLHHQVFQPLAPLVGEERLITPVPERVLTGKVEYNIELSCTFPGERISKVQPVSLVQAGPQMTLSCATTGAQIWWTVDGSFPGPGNELAQMYDGPFALGAGGHCLRTAAHLAGSAGSVVKQERVTV